LSSPVSEFWQRFSEADEVETKNMNNLEQIIEHQERVLEFLKREFEKDISKIDNFTHMPEAEEELESSHQDEMKREENL